MNTIKNSLIEIWTKDLAPKIKSGNITYERQLQAELHYHLKSKHGYEYEIWIEPVIPNKIEGLEKTKPDIIITDNEYILAIIELKFAPWGEPKFKEDLDKLQRFCNNLNKSISLPLGYEPVSSNWKIQKKHTKKIVSKKLGTELLPCFIAFGQPNTEAVNLKNYKNVPNNLLHLYGFIDENGETNLGYRQFS